MNPNDIPPHILVTSYLEALTKAGVEATVVYTITKKGQAKSSAISNRGPEGIARAAKLLKFGDGWLDRSAMALHEFRIKLEGDTSELPDDVKAEMDKCFICRESVSWAELDEPDRMGHRELAKAALMAALATTVGQGPQVTV